jgi:hypothetical protein
MRTFRSSAGWLLGAATLVGASFAFARLLQHRTNQSDRTLVNSEPSVLVSGEVSDRNGPVAGAIVRFQGETTKSANTDADGRFRLSSAHSPAARVTAWKDGYIIGGASADSSPLTITLLRLPSEDHEQYAWIDPQPDPAKPHNCGNCHQEILREWSGSGHARSVTNRRFLNLYDGSDWKGRPSAGWNLLAEHPDGAGVCTACHAPALAFAEDAYYDLSKAHGTAAHGVHCDYCHKIADVANDQIGLAHGRFGLKLLRPARGQLFLGPLDDVDRGEDSFAPIYRQSLYCASCHEGTVFGVHAYGTYSEWLQSPARQEAKQCQTCHMAPTGTLINLAPGKGGIDRDPRTLSNHSMFAGSQLDMLRRCLKLDARPVRRMNTVDVAVTLLADDVGHRVPTGFPDRQLILVVEAFDKEGCSLAPQQGTEGLPKSVGTSLHGRAGRLYAKQLSDFEGSSPVPFWRAQPDAVDTRLFPNRTEQSLYSFPRQTERARIRLLYRRFWEQVRISKGWPEDDLVIVDRLLSVK